MRVIIGTPSSDISSKCVNSNHDVRATDSTKPRKLHHKLCRRGWKLSNALIVCLDQGTTVAVRSTKVLDLLAGQLLIEFDTLLCKITGDMIPTKHLWEIGKILKFEMRLQSGPNLGMILLLTTQCQVISVTLRARLMDGKWKQVGCSGSSMPPNSFEKMLARWFCHDADANGWPYNDRMSGATGWWMCLAWGGTSSAGSRAYVGHDESR